MFTKQIITHALRSVAAMAAGGLLLASSCGFDEVQAIAGGVEAVQSILDRGSDAITLGEWLDEVGDLFD